MRLIKLLPLFVWIMILTEACGVNNLLPASPAILPTASQTVSPSTTPTPLPTLTNTPLPTPTILPTVQAAEYPAWVADFSDPILAAVDNLKPDYYDGFSSLNRGWFYFIPGSRKNPYYAQTENEYLQVKLPAENENKDTWVYNPLLNRRNFVLSFDFQFEATQPEDTVRFQFDQTRTQSIAFDLSKNLNWTLHWGPRDDWQSITGTYEYFPPERISVLFIMKGEECAVYLKDAPLTYLSNCRAGPSVRSVPWAVTFHMLAEPGHTAAFMIDNVRLWDLDKVSGLAGK